MTTVLAPGAYSCPAPTCAAQFNHPLPRRKRAHTCLSPHGAPPHPAARLQAHVGTLFLGSVFSGPEQCVWYSNGEVMGPPLGQVPQAIASLTYAVLCTPRQG